MRFKKPGLILILLFIFLLLRACIAKYAIVYITDAKIATGVDENLMPIKSANVFPKGTAQVFCWFQWKNAQINKTIVAKWRYVTDNIPILDYSFAIPRMEGAGSVSLTMPKNKTLPSGLYRVDLTTGKQILKSLTFKIE